MVPTDAVPGGLFTLFPSVFGPAGAIGAALSLPDVNRVLAKLNGRLLPFGWLRFASWAISRRPGRWSIDRIRVFALGVKPEWQHTGAAAAMYVRHVETARRVRQTWGEMGWILETNEPMNRAMEGMGGEIVKRYRIYELPLASDDVSAPSGDSGVSG